MGNCYIVIYVEAELTWRVDNMQKENTECEFLSKKKY